jgi:hypothetical protein
VVSLTSDKKSKQFFVHRLVLYTFVGEPISPDMTCDHVNRIRHDNRVENLRWATSQQQRSNSVGPIVAAGKAVLQTSLGGEIIARFPSVSKAGRVLKVKRDTVAAWIKSKKVLSSGNVKSMLTHEESPSDGTEQWKTITVDGAPLQVSNLGRVNHTRVSSGSINTNGYVTFSFAGKHRYIHRLVARAFLGEPSAPGFVVHHKDSDRTNNRAANLEWVTPKENSEKSVNEGKMGRMRRQIFRCDDAGEVIQAYKSVREAAKEMGMANPQELHAAARRDYRCRGYKWKLGDKGVQPPDVRS